MPCNIYAKNVIVANVTFCTEVLGYAISIEVWKGLETKVSYVLCVFEWVSWLATFHR